MNQLYPPIEYLVSTNSNLVTLYRATSTTRSNLRVVVKKHEFRHIHLPHTQERITSCLNAALSQAKVQHPHACDILEVQFTVQGSNCEIYHILESMETSVGRDIEARRRYTEAEMRQFMLQTASALAYAHDKKIAHRDVKPDNVFRTENTYKLGDFDCVFIKKDKSISKDYAGDIRYMSPQLWAACTQGTYYNPFKADVFALAASLLHMATLTSPEILATSEPLDEVVRRQVGRLSCSNQLQTLLISMLALEETRRPTMQGVLSALSEEAPPLPRLFHAVPREAMRTSTSSTQRLLPERSQEANIPKLFAAVWSKQVEVYDLESKQFTKHSLSYTFSLGESYIQVDTCTLLCLGASPAATQVCRLDISSLAITSLPHLRIPRCCSGLAKAGNSVFVFGGMSSPLDYLKSCEKYRLEDMQSLPLDDMREERYGFTPCTFRTLIYLSCALTTRTIETFSPNTETFAVLPISLPPQLKPAMSVSFVVNGDLYILTTKQQMGKWRVESGREFRISPTNKECWSSQPPLIMDSLVLIASNCHDGRVEKFSLKSDTFNR